MNHNGKVLSEKCAVKLWTTMLLWLRFGEGLREDWWQITKEDILQKQQWLSI